MDHMDVGEKTTKRRLRNTSDNEESYLFMVRLAFLKRKPLSKNGSPEKDSQEGIRKKFRNPHHTQAMPFSHRLRA